ncbi:hypothetical protein ONR57_13895 [Hoyosella sp. YIM 151337]|uniref:hypothetical protein n=1 Tax=Hoyosella sp. YIM 151337 TaxID=2992742 RepID=UPI0022369CCE|nr:hypothetical protein [Hoyosella sp. YIM 151337]MCW4354396.1 hypothetical protein [Hoyosella sp. YIM 151337]
MFLQVFQGKVADEDGLRRCMDRWSEELQPGAHGYLGSTCGMSDDGTFVCLVRFESEEAARRNSDRPEQGEWWAECERCFDGPVAFMDCADVTLWLDGGSDEAGFVQILEGHTPDAHRMRELLRQTESRMHELRPEIMGATLGTYGEDGYVEAVYFRSEAEAREHEKMEMPDDLRDMLQEEERIMGKVTYYDLHNPMMMSAGAATDRHG